MKKFIEKVQHIGQKAAQIQQAIQSVPPKILEVRQAVATTAGELQQLRSDVQSNLNGLRAHTEQRLVEAMREIHDATETWELVGYELTGMDLDLALNQRLAVHLEKVSDVPHEDIRSLLTQEKSETIKCILSGLIKAEETADTIDLSHLDYHGVTVHVGAAPAIRMSWGSEKFVVAQAPMAATAVQPVVSTSTPSTGPVLGSFFEQRTPTSGPIKVSLPANPSPAPLSEVPVATESSSSTSSVSAKSTSESHWGRSALDRFKKMPDLSKHRS